MTPAFHIVDKIHIKTEVNPSFSIIPSILEQELKMKFLVLVSLSLALVWQTDAFCDTFGCQPRYCWESCLGVQTDDTAKADAYRDIRRTLYSIRNSRYQYTDRK